MNYRTHMFDGEVDRPRYGLTWDDLPLCGRLPGREYFGEDYDTDVRIAAAVRDVLTSPDGQFVVVFKRGNHIPYDLNYPLAQALGRRKAPVAAWIPGCGLGGSTATACLRPTVLQAVRTFACGPTGSIATTMGFATISTVSFTASWGPMARWRAR